MYLPKYLQLLVDASSMKIIHFRNEQGDWVKKGVARAALNALKRPPFIPSAPLKKKEWSKQEIDEFYQKNPLLKV